MFYLDKYAYGNPLSSVHPAEKFLFAMATLVVCLVTNSYLVSLLVIFLMAGVSVGKGNIPLRFYLKLLLLPGSFLTVGVMTIAINIGGDLHQPLVGWRVFNMTFGVTNQSMDLALRLFLRSLSTISCLYFLSLTTPMVEIISVLRKFKFPELLLDILSLMYMFLFILMETAERIHTSQSVRLGYVDLRRGYGSLGQLVSTLFVRSCRRAVQLYTALEARGYQGQLKTLDAEHRFSKINLLGIISLEILLLVVGFGGKYLCQ